MAEQTSSVGDLLWTRHVPGKVPCLHPQVHWTGLCSNSAQVLDWYHRLVADGTIATVRSVEVDRDAVVLGLTVAQQAEGARPAPPQQLYQVFTIDGAQIIDIRGYPDRRSALART